MVLDDQHNRGEGGKSCICRTWLELNGIQATPFSHFSPLHALFSMYKMEELRVNVVMKLSFVSRHVSQCTHDSTVWCILFCNVY
jgi:hypothetical protein